MIRPAKPEDFASILALNEESVRFLSPLTEQRLIKLAAEAELHSVVEERDVVVAFLLAFREGANYDSINYQWFASRYPRFLYVDRVVVSAGYQGKGAGRQLYDQVFAHARQIGAPVVACEYDVEPPNEPSRRFHLSFGFSEVGRQVVAGGAKVVSLQLSPVHRQQPGD